jgi:hypothetical protein
MNNKYKDSVVVVVGVHIQATRKLGGLVDKVGKLISHAGCSVSTKFLGGWTD